jgi:hypothetical protein
MVNEANPNRAKNPRVRTWGGSADRPVVATAPKPYVPTAGVSAQQNARNADAYALTVPYVSGAKQAADAEAEATRIANQVLGGQSYGGTGTRSDTAFQNALSMLTSGGTGTRTGPKASDILARDEFKYKKEQDILDANYRDRQDALAQQIRDKQDADAKAIRDRQLGIEDRSLQGMIDQLNSGSYRGNIDSLIAQIEAMGATGKQDIGNIYDSAVANIGNIYSSGIGDIGQGYNTAQGLMDTGYGALQSYLQQNQNNPYAGLSAQMPTVTNPMEGYLNAYGAMSPDVANQIQAEQFAGQQSAGAFQSLIDVLGANAKSNDLSRLAEAQMSRTMGTTGLGAQRAAYESELAKRKAASGFEASSAQQQALAALAQQIAQSKFQQEQNAGNRYQSILDAIIAAGGSLNGPSVGGNSPVGGGSPVVNNSPVINNNLGGGINLGGGNGLSQDILDQLARRRTGF